MTTRENKKNTARPPEIPPDALKPRQNKRIDQDKALQELAHAANVSLDEIVDMSTEATALEEPESEPAENRVNEELLNKFLALTRHHADVSQPEDIKETAKMYLSAKGKRILQHYIPVLFHRKNEFHRGPDKEAPVSVRSTATTKGVKEIIKQAGLQEKDKKSLSNTREHLLHEIPLKINELSAELARRSQNEATDVDNRTLTKQLEALGILNDVLNNKNEYGTFDTIEQPYTAPDSKISEENRNMISQTLKTDIDEFAQVFAKQFEGENAKLIAAFRARKTEVNIPRMQQKNPVKRLVSAIRSRFSQTPEKRHEEQKVQADLEAYQEQIASHRSIGPTFTKEGFLQATNLQDAIDGNFTDLDDLENKLYRQLDKSRRKLKEDYALSGTTQTKTPRRRPSSSEALYEDMGELDTMAELKKVPWSAVHLRRSLANTAMIERLIAKVESLKHNKQISHTRDTINTRPTQILPKISLEAPPTSETPAPPLIIAGVTLRKGSKSKAA